MSKFNRAKRNLIILKIFELMENAEKHNYTLTIVDVPKYIVRFFRNCGLDDYLTRGRASWDVLTNDITILGSHHYKIESSLDVGQHVSFYKIKQEIDDYISGGPMLEEYYHIIQDIPSSSFLSYNNFSGGLLHVTR